MAYRIFAVKIDRSDRDKPDTIYVGAYTRDEAEAGIRKMFGERCLKIYPPRKRRSPKSC